MEDLESSESESEESFDEGSELNEDGTESDDDGAGIISDFIVCHFVFIKLSFTRRSRTWQCQPLFYEASFLPKH